MITDSQNVVIYKYSTIASYMFERFLDDQEDSILRQGNKIIFARNYDTKFLIRAFSDYMNDFFNLEKYPYGKSKTLVVGTCYSHHNWLSKYIDEIESDMSKKFIKSKVPVRYAFSDRTIMADESMINQLLDTLVGKLIRGDISVYTPNYIKVKFIFAKDVSESHIATVLKSHHEKCEIYPNNKDELFFDINKMVYKSISSKHRVNSLIKERVLYVYDLACSPEEEE